MAEQGRTESARSELSRRRFLGTTAVAGAGIAVTWGPLAQSAGASEGGLWAGHARTEYAVNLLGTDVSRPRFAWTLESSHRSQSQSAYQVLVASTEQHLTADRGDVWDSGKVPSARSVQVPYDGPELESGHRYHWKVRTWDAVGAVSEWSEPAWWEMGLLDERAWQGARWIGRGASDTGQPPAAPLLRRVFELAAPVTRARLYLSGLGYYEARINGHRVGDHVLDPGHTDYQDSVLYVTHDVTDLLVGGANALGVELGRGWYGVSTGSAWNWDTAPWHGDPKLRALLVVTHSDGSTTTVTSDDSWVATAGPTRFDDVYVGETYDAGLAELGWDRPGFDDEGWDAAVPVDAPAGGLRAQTHEPVRIAETVDPVAVTEPETGVYVFDFGFQISGWARLGVTGLAGAEVELYYGERLDDSGRVTIPSYTDFHEVQQGQTDRYLAPASAAGGGHGGEDAWEPKFTYKGFRYVQVTGLPERPRPGALVARRMHNDVRPVGHFACGEPLLEQIRGNVRRALMNNHHHVPTDTPVYEKNGWTGDAQLTVTTAMYEYDMARFHTKWLADFSDAQLADGELPTIVPTPGWSYEGSDGWTAVHGPTPVWDAALLLIPWHLYEFYGDRRILETYFPAMRRYFDWLTSHAENHLLDLGLGDWLPPGGEPPEGPVLSSTAHSYLFARTLAEIGEVLGDSAAAADYRARGETIRAAFNATFFDETPQGQGRYRTPGFDGYRQTSNILPLAFGLVPEGREGDVVAGLVADIDQRGGHLDTGIVGTRYLLPVLSRHGRVDVAYRVATQRTYPGWGYWIELGRTALQEHWEADTRSLDHHMFGSIGHWFYADLVGITPAEPGWAVVRVRPRVPPQLDHAEARTETVRGVTGARWRKLGSRERLELDVEIPAGATGEVHMPARDEASVTPVPASAVEFLRMEDGAAVFATGSGAYTFIGREEKDEH